MSQAARPPEGDLYDWYRRGLALLEAGDAAAAAQVLVHAVSADSESASLREALGRARLGAKQYELAREDFEYLVATRPDDDFAHFGLGLALSRLGLWSAAVEQLALACALRPERADYQRELTHARATVQSRQAARRTGGQP